MKVSIDPSTFGNWALITGASSGIGKGFAEKLAAAGLNIVLVARRIELIQDIGERLSLRHKVQFRVIQADLEKSKDIETIIEKTKDLTIGLLISNAGTGDVGKFFERNINDLQGRVQLNSISHLSLTHHFGKKMAAIRKGGILLTGAMGAVEGAPYMSTEAATKGFVQALGKSLHEELKEFGIHITVLVTTPTETPVFYKLGFTMKNSPVKPISVDQCVTESLDALVKNKMLIYPGLKFRVMRALTPGSLSRKIFAKILKKNNQIQ